MIPATVKFRVKVIIERIVMNPEDEPKLGLWDSNTMFETDSTYEAEDYFKGVLDLCGFKPNGFPKE